MYGCDQCHTGAQGRPHRADHDTGLPRCARVAPRAGAATLCAFVEKAAPLVPRNLRFEVLERIGADGSIVQRLDEESLERAIVAAREADVEAIAVCLINSFANPVHEQRIGARLRAEMPGLFISLSTEVLPQIREYERTSTTVVNAYVGPPLKFYLRAMIDQLAAAGVRGRLLVM
jgi:N-methylhydantoinase A